MFPRIDKGPIEYLLWMGPAYNEEQRRECLRFHFRTTEEFHHFQYRIAIEELVKKETMRFTLKGLKTKGLTLPGVGMAEGVVDLFDVSGTFRVSVLKPGNIENAFAILVENNRVSVLEPVSGKQLFLELFTDE